MAEPGPLLVRGRADCLCAARRTASRVFRAARSSSASSTSTTGRIMSIRPCSTISAKRPASRSATIRSIQATRWRPSFSPGNPDTMWWCRPAISSPAKSRPAFSRNWTSRSCPIWSMSGRKSRNGSRPTIRAINTPSTTCGGRPASATTSKDAQQILGADAAIDSWAYVVRSRQNRTSSRIAAFISSIHPTTSCPPRCTICTSIPIRAIPAIWKRPPICC